MREIEIMTRASPATICAVAGLVEAIEIETDVRPLSDHLLLDLQGGGGPGYVGVQVVESDALVAYAQVSSSVDERLLEMVIAPGSDAEEITKAFLPPAVDAVAASGGGRLVWWIHDVGDAGRAIAALAGFFPDRRLFQMRCELPTARSPGITTRAFRPGTDDAAWLRVNNRAFEKHAEQGGWTLDMLHQRVAADWFDADGFRIHEQDDRMIGFCWTKVHHSTNPPMGEIYVVAVHPDAHGSGLGSQLTLAGLEWLADRGHSTGMLYVDADNTTAVAMYRRLGFTVHRTDQSFVRDISAAAPSRKVNE